MVVSVFQCTCPEIQAVGTREALSMARILAASRG